MRKKLHVAFLSFMLILLLVLCGMAVYMLLLTQQEQEEAAASVTETYDYEEIQELVTLPVTIERPKKEVEEEFTPPYITEEMLSINKDFKGWLWIPNCDINYPVVQTDNNNTYLKTSFQGEYSFYGSLFLDKDSLDGCRNRIIHGHNMGGTRSEMFSTLINYQDPAWAEERQIAYFTEPDAMQDNAYQLFAVLNFDLNTQDFTYFQTDFETEEDFQGFVNYLKERSLFETDFNPERDLLILSTCNRYYGYDNRLLVCFGRIAAEE